MYAAMLAFLNIYDIWIWLTLVIIFLVIEGATMMLTTIWAAVASFPLIFIAKTSLGFQWQVLIFVILTLALVILTRPLATKKFKLGKFKTNIESFQNQEFIVVEKVSRLKKGTVKSSNGVVWNAKTLDNIEISPNTMCKVVSVEGNTLVVENTAK